MFQYVSELRFDGFSLRSPAPDTSGSSLLQSPYTSTDHKLQSEVSPALFTTILNSRLSMFLFTRGPENSDNLCPTCGSCLHRKQNMVIRSALKGVRADLIRLNRHVVHFVHSALHWVQCGLCWGDETFCSVLFYSINTEFPSSHIIYGPNGNALIVVWWRWLKSVILQLVWHFSIDKQLAVVLYKELQECARTS